MKKIKRVPCAARGLKLPARRIVLKWHIHALVWLCRIIDPPQEVFLQRMDLSGHLLHINELDESLVSLDVERRDAAVEELEKILHQVACSVIESRLEGFSVLIAGRRLLS